MAPYYVSRIWETLQIWLTLLSRGFGLNPGDNQSNVSSFQFLGQPGAPATQRPTDPPRTEAPVTARPKPTRAPYEPDACTTSFDTFFMDAARRTYAFKGQYYWVIGHNAGLESGPHKIDSRWREIREPVDAAFTRRDGRTIFFIGSR